MAVPEMIWSASKVTHMSAWIRAKSEPGREGEPQPHEGASGEGGPDDAGEGADEHEAFEPDVDDPAPLAEHAAEGGEDERRREADGRGEQLSRGAEDIAHYRPSPSSRWVPARSRARLPSTNSTSFVAVTSSRITASSTLASCSGTSAVNCISWAPA